MVQRDDRIYPRRRLFRILNDPTSIFNLDETAFYLTAVGGKAFVKKGSKSVYSFVSNNDKECVTSLIGSNADGPFVPTMVVFQLVRILQLFFEYIANIFHPWLLQNKVKFPLIVFIDGHSSYMTLHLSEF